MDSTIKKYEKYINMGVSGIEGLLITNKSLENVISMKKGEECESIVDYMENKSKKEAEDYMRYFKRWFFIEKCANILEGIFYEVIFFSPILIYTYDGSLQISVIVSLIISFIMTLIIHKATKNQFYENGLDENNVEIMSSSLSFKINNVMAGLISQYKFWMVVLIVNIILAFFY